RKLSSGKGISTQFKQLPLALFNSYFAGIRIPTVVSKNQGASATIFSIAGGYPRAVMGSWEKSYAVIEPKKETVGVTSIFTKVGNSEILL
ncbi:MAG: hypothetical protein ACOC0H_06560, partial [Thermodesulfobacteriota bacterium]